MNFLIYSIIFLLCIIFYIHIFYHLKISNDENVYEIDYINTSNLEEICNLRQPFTFKLPKQINLKKTDIISQKEKLNIIKSKKIIKEQKDDSSNTKSENKIYSEYNKQLLLNDNINKKINTIDKYIKPDFTFNNIYDIIVSDENYSTPTISNYNYRNYYIVTEGNIDVTFISPIHNKKLNYITDYELMQNVIKSPIKKNIKINTIHASEGDIIYIPPHWWYSIHFNSSSVILKYQFRTVMNMLSYIPNYILSYISIQKAENNKKKKKLFKK